MIILRINGKKPYYTDTSGKKITDTATIEYINSLVIPPNYVDVKIFTCVKKGSVCQPPKLTYTGIDTKGRIQYGYSKQWKKKAKSRKFDDLLLFGRALPKLRLHIKKVLGDASASKSPTLDFCISLILDIVGRCHFRIGNMKYRELYKSYGISNIEVHHIKFGANKTSINFIGKKGVKNDCDITDKPTIAHLSNLVAHKSPKDHVFSHNVEGCATVVKAIEINDWIQQFGNNITSKMFRTFATNIMLIELLNKALKADAPKTVSARKKLLNTALDEVSERVHNTRSVCKNEYTHPDIVDIFLNNPKKWTKYFDNDDHEASFMLYLMNNKSKNVDTYSSDG
jgi:DNA topoisomerase-1